MAGRAVCWIGGRIVPAAEASVSVFDHGLLYGDGVFEGIRFYKRKPFRLAAHLERLKWSARAIGLTIPKPRADLAAIVQDTVDAFAEPDGYLRLVVTRGSGPLGIDPATCGAPTLFVIADRIAIASEEVARRGARVIIASTRRLGPDGLDPRIKSLNYLNHVLARMEANHAGADEALLLNGAGRVAEGAAENVFVARGGALITPPVSEGALEGVTRGVVLELAAQAGIPARETPLAPYDLYMADECFLTGTGAELIPVAEVDGRRMAACPGPVFTALRERFRKAVGAD